MLKIFSLFFLLTLSVSITEAQSLAAIENELLAHVEKLEKASNYGGGSDYALLAKENKLLRNALIKYGSRSDVLECRFSKLAERIFLTTSKDGRFRAYSWDTEEGGTMHDYITVYQFKGQSGKAYSWAPPYSDDLGNNRAGGFVHQIFQTSTKSGPIYLTVSTFIGSTSLASQTISTVKINGEKLNTRARMIQTSKGITDSISFGYDFFSVVDHAERPIKLFEFDETRKEFRFPVVIEDEKTPQGRVTTRFITYRLNGSYFFKVI